MADRSITDDLLKITIGLRSDAGVSMSDIRRLIGEFADDQGCKEGAGGAVGFLWIEDVPQYRREQFLNALAALSPSIDHRHPDATRRAISAAEIWPSRVAD
jgi:hypothetical protein